MKELGTLDEYGTCSVEHNSAFKARKLRGVYQVSAAGV